MKNGSGVSGPDSRKNRFDSRLKAQPHSLYESTHRPTCPLNPSFVLNIRARRAGWTKDS
jgi:hypothetical protein